MLIYRFLRVVEALGIRTRFGADVEAIRKSGLFDAAWYRRQLGSSSRPADPVAHYVLRGAEQGLDPHPLFDTRFYASDLAGLPAHRRNPLAHYQDVGAAAGRDPSEWFDTRWYLSSSGTVLAEGTTPLADYWTTPPARQGTPHPLFEADWYRTRYAGEIEHPNPVVDFIAGGGKQGRVPHRAFDTADRRDPAAIMDTVRAAMATLDPDGPRRTRIKDFSERREETFLRILGRRVAAGKLLDDPPKVSIVMATRNRAGILPKAIASVVAQEYGNWELLVVDDGGDDDTPAVVEGFADSRIRYLRGRGGGAGDARNIGMAAAEGDLFAYLDSDNQWTPTFLKTMVSFLLAEKLDLAYSGMRLESEDDVQFRGRAFKYDDLVNLNYIDVNSILHRRSLVDRFGCFDTTLRRMEDWDLLLRYTKAAKTKYAPFLGVIYDEHRRPDRITIQESIAWRFDVMNRYLIDWDGLGAASGAREKGLVSIVIPVYGKFELTNACLESLFRIKDDVRFEVVIVNNKSDHATLANMALWEKTHANVRVAASWTNLNFALGCNFGFAHTRGETVVFLNNDTIVTDGWLTPLVEELADARVGAVQPKLLYPDGTVQSYGAAFSEAGIISHMLYRGEPGDAPHVARRRELQAIHGACVAVRAADFIALRGFDPQFVNGQEDIDFCLRLTAATGKVSVVAPRSTIVHFEGKTRGRNPHNRRNRSVFVARWRDRVRADDRRIYQDDGFVVAAYVPDSEEWAKHGIACFVPSLVRTDVP